LPLYEYHCAKDGRFEVIRKFSDPPLAVCPTCGRRVQKLPSAPAIQFKGSGWYVNDYAKKAPGDGASKPDAAKAEAGASSSGAASSSPSDANSAKPGKSKGAKASGDKSSK
jgi:putative FmdB family regulatory protein